MLKSLSLLMDNVYMLIVISLSRFVSESNYQRM